MAVLGGGGGESGRACEGGKVGEEGREGLVGRGGVVCGVVHELGWRLCDVTHFWSATDDCV